MFSSSFWKPKKKITNHSGYFFLIWYDEPKKAQIFVSGWKNLRCYCSFVSPTVEVMKSQSLFFPVWLGLWLCTVTLCHTSANKASLFTQHQTPKTQLHGIKFFLLLTAEMLKLTWAKAGYIVSAGLTERWLVRILIKHCWLRIFLENLFTSLKMRKSGEINFQRRKWFTNLGVLRLHLKAVALRYILLALQ